MRGGDEDRRGSDRAFQHRGLGINPHRACWKCNKPKPQSDGKYLGKLKLWHCRDCVKQKEAISA